MKKRIFYLVLAIILCLSAATASLATTITPMQASGRSSMSYQAGQYRLADFLLQRKLRM